MGLDTVELVMEVEETFNIEIDDKDLEHIISVGDLLDCVATICQAVNTGTSLVDETIDDLKSGMLLIGVSGDVTTNTKLDEIFPRARRRQLWSQLAQQTGLSLPRLVRPSWIIFLILLLSIGCGLLISLQMAVSMNQTVAWWFVSTILIVVASYAATMPFAIMFGSKAETMGVLAETVLVQNLEAIQAKHGPMTKKDVWPILKSLIVEQLGAEPDEVVLEAEFIKDLGCG